MFTTIRRISIGSAFRVGFVVCGLLAVIFGLLFVVLQGLFLTGLANLTRGSTFPNGAAPYNFSAFLGAGVLSVLCFYGVLVVFGAIFGGIQFAIGAFCYNLAAGWVGGLQIELQSGDSGLLDDIERDLRRPRDPGGI